MREKQIGVLFVCLGNICRSPTAQGVFEKLVLDHGLKDQIFVDSAGCSNYHAGQAPDKRSINAALKRGVDLNSQRARQVQAEDFERFDYILAMDRKNLAYLNSMPAIKTNCQVKLFLEMAPELNVLEVPDPYNEDLDGFEYVLDLIEVASKGFLTKIQQEETLS